MRQAVKVLEARPPGGFKQQWAESPDGKWFRRTYVRHYGRKAPGKRYVVAHPKTPGHWGKWEASDAPPQDATPAPSKALIPY
jgi:hypothetical protein